MKCISWSQRYLAFSWFGSSRIIVNKYHCIVSHVLKNKQQLWKSLHTEESVIVYGEILVSYGKISRCEWENKSWHMGKHQLLHRNQKICRCNKKKIFFEGVALSTPFYQAKILLFYFTYLGLQCLVRFLCFCGIHVVNRTWFFSASSSFPLHGLPQHGLPRVLPV